MSNDPRDPAACVRAVAESTRQCLQELRAENAALHELVAQLRGQGAAAGAGGADGRLCELREALARAEHEALRQREVVEGLRAELARYEQQRAALEARLEESRVEHRASAERTLRLEQQTSTLSSLFVATCQLHQTLERYEVLAIIQEIVANVIGSEELAIYEVAPGRAELTLAQAWGVAERCPDRVPLGQGPIGVCAMRSDTWIAPEGAGGAEPTVCVPLRLGGQTTGVIAVFRLLPQKKRLESLDHELFELLATHAAMALYATSLHARFAGRAGQAA